MAALFSCFLCSRQTTAVHRVSDTTDWHTLRPNASSTLVRCRSNSLTHTHSCARLMCFAYYAGIRIEFYISFHYRHRTEYAGKGDVFARNNRNRVNCISWHIYFYFRFVRINKTPVFVSVHRTLNNGKMSNHVRSMIDIHVEVSIRHCRIDSSIVQIFWKMAV